MKRSKIWVIVLASAVSCGVLLGVVLFASFGMEPEEPGRPRGGSFGTEQEETGPDIEILTEEPDGSERTDEAASGQKETKKANPGRETDETEARISKPEPESETGETESESEIETGPESETMLEEDFSAYYGTYVPAGGRALMINLGEDSSKMSRPYEISEKALLYIDEMKRSADGNEILGYIDYFGLRQWVPLEKLEKIVPEDYSIQIGEECVLCENLTGVDMRKQPDRESGIYDVSFHVGDTFRVLDMENGYFETSYYNSASMEYVQGWIDGSFVTKLYTEIPYRMVWAGYEEQEIPFYLEHPGSADIVIQEADGYIGENSVLWFEQFSGGWGRTKLNGEEAWVNMMNAVPLPQTQQQKVLSYKKNEKKPEGRTDFYKDGRSVSADAYILPEAQQRFLSDQDVAGLTLRGLSYAKNELYAKYGRKFESPELAEYMASKTWYRPLYESRKYDEVIVNLMNEYERKNIAFLNAWESELGP